MMKTILSNLTERLSQLEAGNLTQAEMELMVEDAKELFERLVILRYKIYETNVLGPREVAEPIVSAHIDALEEETAETPSFDLFEMSAEVAATSEPEIPIAPMDLTVSEELPEESDLFQMEIETQEDPLEMIEEDNIETSVQEESLMDDFEDELTENPIEEELETEVESSEEEIVMEEESSEEADETIVEELSIEETPVSTSAAQENFLDTIENPETTSINSAWIMQIEQTIRGDRSVFPLETLIGSFSLNEKLQFINELFDGSSDAFSTATKKLDSCVDMAAAREQLSDFSSTYQWDLDSEIVEDFIFKICRRYATSAS
ncbi:MAG: hypothetical protein ACKOXP_05495 [Flavobacteriales bacterium]